MNISGLTTCGTWVSMSSLAVTMISLPITTIARPLTLRRSDLATVWNAYYGLIEQSNIIIQNVPQYYSKTGESYNTRLGEGYSSPCIWLLRVGKAVWWCALEAAAFCWCETVTRASAEDCYKQIIADFEQAYSLLPTATKQNGRILKSAAAHFLAKTHLFRASEANDSWNSSYKSSDLEAVIKYGKRSSLHILFVQTSSICGTTQSPILPTRVSAR